MTAAAAAAERGRGEEGGMIEKRARAVEEMQRLPTSLHSTVRVFQFWMCVQWRLYIARMVA